MTRPRQPAGPRVSALRDAVLALFSGLNGADETSAPIGTITSLVSPVLEALPGEMARALVTQLENAAEVRSRYACTLGGDVGAEL